MSTAPDRKTLVLLFLSVLIIAPLVTVLALSLGFVASFLIGLESSSNLDAKELLFFSSISLFIAYTWGLIPTAIVAGILTWMRTKGPLTFQKFMTTCLVCGAAVLSLLGVVVFGQIGYTAMIFITFLTLAALTWKLLSGLPIIGVSHD